MVGSKKDFPKNDSAAVSALIENLDEPLRSLVEAIRRAILEADESVGEQVKWNSPSFFFTGEMPDFDPKTYARDLVVVDSRRGSPLLVFPSGEKITGVPDFLEGNFPDGRRLARIGSLDVLAEKKAVLQAAVRAWLEGAKKA